MVNDPVLVLELGGLKRKKDAKSEEQQAQKEALMLSASKVRKAMESGDDEKLAVALMDFQALCSGLSHEEEPEEEY